MSFFCGSPCPFCIADTRCRLRSPSWAPLHHFCRGWCSACSPVSCTLCAKDHSLCQSHNFRYRPFSHVMNVYVCRAPHKACSTAVYGDAPMRRHVRTRQLNFVYIVLHRGANVKQNNSRLCTITDRITDRKVLGFGFSLQITEKRRESDNRPSRKTASVTNPGSNIMLCNLLREI